MRELPSRALAEGQLMELTGKVYALEGGETRVKVIEEKDGRVWFARDGGGPVMSATRDVFLSDFREARPIEVQPWRPGKVTAEFLPLLADGPEDGREELDCYLRDGESWNGWACPVFRVHDQIEAAVKALRSENVIYDRGARVVRIEGFSGSDESEYVAFDINVEGEAVPVVALGAGSWIWDRCDPQASK